MSVLIVTSLGDLVVDLFTNECPLTCKNFLKLCKMKYFNGCLFHTIQKDFTAQTGDPTGTGAGGDSVYKFLYGDQARFFNDEIHPNLKHTKMGTFAMASAGENMNASQFYITLRDDLDYLDGKHTVFGEVAEGLETTLTRINEAYVDEKNRPYKDIRIKHTYILEDPFEDPNELPGLIPDASPEGKPKEEALGVVRLEDDWVPLDEQLRPEELEEIIREKDAHSRAVVLESIGDIPDAEVKPPENVLFVCKLNPVTEDEDLHTIFSRFGNVVSADIIREFKTGNSLCYAFIDFETREACERAYFKMDNALIDDRRIKVDFSQSVARLWGQYRRRGKDSGGGCFKCGAVDHLARDCTDGLGSKSQGPKYILKDDNTQRGSDNSRYDMVFDGEAPGSPIQEKSRRSQGEQDEQLDKERRRHRRISDDRDEEIKDLSKGKIRQNDRRRVDEDDDSDRRRDSKATRYQHESRIKDHGGDRGDGKKTSTAHHGRRERIESDRDKDHYKRRSGEGDYWRRSDEGKDRIHLKELDDDSKERKRRHGESDRQETRDREERDEGREHKRRDPAGDHRRESRDREREYRHKSDIRR
ncbi:unnamed protein product [Linum tenue]|uniref:Peptidyl-prolyl cis-trans isomerase n=1 Tax=Linum tenue TaxID=586396 RepID=A0AAV0MUI3_9ROSI|nr:unnamed protein product [Linum tenue]